MQMKRKLDFLPHPVHCTITRRLTADKRRDVYIWVLTVREGLKVVQRRRSLKMSTTQLRLRDGTPFPAIAFGTGTTLKFKDEVCLDSCHDIYRICKWIFCSKIVILATLGWKGLLLSYLCLEWDAFSSMTCIPFIVFRIRSRPLCFG